MAVLAGLTLGGCNGGGSDSSDNANPLPPGANTTAKLSGAYAGHLTDNADQKTSDFRGYIRTSGVGYFISFGASRLYRLALTSEGNQLNGTMRTYNITDYNSFYIAADFATTANMSGDFDYRSGAQGSINNAGTQTGTFALNFDKTHTDLGASLATIQGRWANTDNSKNASLTLTFSSDGSFTGNDNSGCAYTGKIAVDNANVNVYEVSSLSAVCLDSAKQLQGILVYSNDAGQGKHIGIFASDDSQVFAWNLIRQQ